MIIASLGRSPAAAPRTRGRPDAGSFAVASLDERPAAALHVAPASALDAMLALQEQEQDCAATSDRRARQHGQSLLQALAALQHALLAGIDEAAPLQRLAALAEYGPAAADPQLGAIIQAVVLRARVELARRGM